VSFKASRNMAEKFITYQCKQKPQFVQLSKFGLRDIVKMRSSGACYPRFGDVFRYFWGSAYAPRGSDRFTEIGNPYINGKVWSIRGIAFHPDFCRILFWLTDGTHNIVSEDKYFDMVSKRFHTDKNIVNIDVAN